MHFSSYIRSALQIIGEYDGSVPFASYLKNFFRANKKYGSRDRKAIGSLCYCYYRLGVGLHEQDASERILAAQLLCSTAENPCLAELAPQWKDSVSLSLEDKTSLLQLTPANLFPLIEELSPHIDGKKFASSMLIQPDFFLRVRPGNLPVVLSKLQAASIPFELVNDTIIALPAGTKIDDVLEVDSEVVVQDFNSQQTMSLFLQHASGASGEEGSTSKRHRLSVWDCCAASGGKSILLHDLCPATQLTVSDIRESILINLRNRFRRAGIQKFKSFVFDASASDPDFGAFDLVICDAPCSGSGTWSRTPEQLSYFPGDKIEYYAGLQKKIAGHASKAVKNSGHFLYITCSVFKKENEDVVDHITRATPLRLVEQKYLPGYERRADTLFAALFSAP